MKKMRKGFTLVELLIVIAIIAVLASMMTLSSSDATVAAKAASIANGFKTLASAYSVYSGATSSPTSADFVSNSKDYLGPQVKNLTKFSITQGTGATYDKVYATYTFDATTETKVQTVFTNTYSSDMGMTGTSNSATMLIH